MKRIKTYKEYKLLYFDKLIEYKNNEDRYFYIYRITDLKNSKHYYGSRVSVCYPKYDLGEKYFSSSRDIAFLQAQKSYKERFKYKIIKIFNNNDDKILYESFLHQYFNVKNNDMFFNKVNQTPTRFDTTGFVTCLNLLTDEICFVTKEEFDNSYNLVGIGYGMVNCIDIQTNKFIRVSKEEFNSNINLISISYGKVTCIDKISGKYKQVTKEEFDSNPNLVGVLYDKVNCIDKEKI